VRGTAQHAKTGASLLAASIGGGTFAPFAQHAAALSHGQPWSYSTIIAMWSVAAIYVVYLNFVPQAKRQVDPVKDDYIRSSNAIATLFCSEVPVNISVQTNRLKLDWKAEGDFPCLHGPRSLLKPNQIIVITF
jgi:hypothetical protein